MPEYDLFTVKSWPIWFACILLVQGSYAYRNSQGNVPNSLTYSAILFAWLAALALSQGVKLQTGGNLQSSIVTTLVPLTLMIPIFRMAGIGAGCVKLQAAFGAWLGVALPLYQAFFLFMTATFVGLIFTYVGGMIYKRRSKNTQTESATLRFPAAITFSAGSIFTVLAFALLRVGST